MSGKLPWLRFWTTDFTMETRLLKPNEVGIFIRLMVAIYENGGAIEDNLSRLARFVVGTEKATLKAALERLVGIGLIDRSNGHITAPSVDYEMEWQADRSEKNRKNAQARGRKANKNNGASERSLAHNHNAQPGGLSAPPTVSALRSTEEGIALERDPAQRPVLDIGRVSDGAEIDLPGVGACIVEATDRFGHVWARSFGTGKDYKAFLNDGTWSGIVECDPDDPDDMSSTDTHFARASQGAR